MAAMLAPALEPAASSLALVRSCAHPQNSDARPRATILQLIVQLRAPPPGSRRVNGLLSSRGGQRDNPSLATRVKGVPQPLLLVRRRGLGREGCLLVFER